VEFITGIEYWHWLLLGLVLLIAELATGSTYLLWPAVAAWIVGVAALVLPIGFAPQLTIFSIATIALTITGRTYIRGKWLTQGGDPHLNEPAARLIGAVAYAAGDFHEGAGRVKLADSEWRAESADPIAAGDAVTVLAVDGATLKVRRKG
jgi:inner membrane protein